MRTQLLLAAMLLALAAIWPAGERAETAVARSAPGAVINEVAWSGTSASSSDEWIELYNPSYREVDLTGWTLRWGEGEREIVIHFGPPPDGARTSTREIRKHAIPAQGFYLLERTDDETVGDVAADLIYSGALGNGGDAIKLEDAQGEIVDTANGDGGEWPAGTAGGAEPPYATMERIDPSSGDADDNWASNDGTTRNGRDRDGNPINGTPKQENSR